VRSALARIAQGCLRRVSALREEINPKRLKVVPWTPYCIKCQEAADRHEIRAVELSDSVLAAPLNPRVRGSLPRGFIGSHAETFSL